MKHISITTDFGSGVGSMRGVIWNIAPDAMISDIYSQIPPQDVKFAAWYLDHEVWYFPPGSIHLVVVDPGVGTPRRPIAAQIGEHFFVGPDRGKLKIGDRIIVGIRKTFGEAQSGELIALYGTAGYIIVAVVNGSAYEILKPEIGDKVQLIY